MPSTADDNAASSSTKKSRVSEVTSVTNMEQKKLCQTTRQKQGCGQLKLLSEFRSYGCRHLSSTCWQCEFPVCANAGCSVRRDEAKGPVSKAELKDGLWLCGRTQCQKLKKRCQGKHHKETGTAAEFRRWDEKICRACQFPQCKSCGLQHGGQRAIYETATGWLNGEWYCKACERPARKQALMEKPSAAQD